MAKVLVTGARGQLGRQLLARSGRAGLDLDGADSSALDITDTDGVRSALEQHRPDVVINCAAYTAVDAAEADEDRARAVNEAGAANVARACEDVGARLIHVSTDYVFAGDGDAPYEPRDPTGPRSVYGRTKLAGERAVLEVSPEARVVRTAWVYTGDEGDFVATMRRLERERDSLSVVDDQRGSPTFSGDLADGLLELAVRGADSRVLHLTNGGVATWFELARAVFDEIGADPARIAPCTTAQFPRPAPRPAYSVLSGRVWANAGLTPLRDWRQALHAALSAS